MIADECKSLRLKLEQVTKAKLNQQTVEQLSERQNDLLELRDKVVVAVLAANALSKRTAIIGNLDSTKAIERVQKLREALKSDPQSITKGRDLTLMKNAFEKFVDEATKATELTWDQYLPRARPNVDPKQVAQAEQQGAFRAKSSKIMASAKLADQLCKRPPLTEADFANLEAIWQEIRELIDALPAVTNDPEVQEFLKLANSAKGASLDMLTAEVIAWLKDNKADDKYRIFNS